MKTLKYIFYGIVTAFIIWIAASYIDIISDNLTENPKHSEYNAIVLFVDCIGEE